MRKTKEQLELLFVMQKHKISELTQIYSNLDATYYTNFLMLNRIGKAKMKLNHYKQLLNNLLIAEQLYKETEHLFKKQNEEEFKVGDKVKIKDGWQNSYLYVPRLAKFIGLEGLVISISELGNYKVRTSLDVRMLDNDLYSFPPKALELVS